MVLFWISFCVFQSDKKLEKRMRPMQLSKPGVLSDEPVKENDNSDSCMDDPTTPEIHIPTLHTDSHQLIHPNELDSKVMIISAEEVREDEWFVNFFKKFGYDVCVSFDWLLFLENRLL